MTDTNEKELIACPVCLDTLVGPYTMGCGHSICAQCFTHLTKDECPTCRFKFRNKEKHGVNLALESILRNYVPNYDQLRDKQQKYIKSLYILSKYKQSKRYKYDRKKIRDFLSEEDYCCSLADLETHFLNPLLTEDMQTVEELYYILDHDKDIYQITISDKKYVIYEDSDLLKPLSKLKTYIGNIDNLEKSLSIIGLLSHVYSIDELAILDIPLPLKKFQADPTNLANFLTALPIGELMPCGGSDSSTDYSDSDSD
jgi:hypothetical protein